MKDHVLAAMLTGVLIVLPQVAPASGQGPLRIAVERLTELPSGVRQPEGLAVDPTTGDIFVGTFDSRMPESERNNQLLRFSRQGKLLQQRHFGATPLTGLALAEGKIYVLNFGASKLQRLPATFDAGTPIEDVVTFKALTPAAPTSRRINNPEGSHDQIVYGSSGFPGINGMVFDRAGNLYVSDSFQGAIYRITQASECNPCEVTVVSRDPLLGTSAPALRSQWSGTERRRKHPLCHQCRRWPPAPHAPTCRGVGNRGGECLRCRWPVVSSGLVWAASNQTDTIVALDETGRVQVRAGEFIGIDNGAPVGLLFPASTAVQGDWMIVANLSLPITPMEGDEWEEQVSRWTLSRFKLPPVH